MRTRAGLICATLACAALACVKPASAQDATSSDVRCMIALSAAAQSADGQVKPAMMAGVIYYLGRLDGRTPTLDLEARAAAERKAMSVQDLNDETVRCGAALLARSKTVAAIGARLAGGGPPDAGPPDPGSR